MTNNISSSAAFINRDLLNSALKLGQIQRLCFHDYEITENCFDFHQFVLVASDEVELFGCHTAHYSDRWRDVQ